MELWVGLSALKRDPKCKNFRSFEGKGAWVQVVSWSETREQFEEKVRTISSRDLDCILCELEDVEPLEERMKKEDFPDEFIEMRATAYRQPEDTVFGTFYTWLQDEAN